MSPSEEKKEKKIFTGTAQEYISTRLADLKTLYPDRKTLPLKSLTEEEKDGYYVPEGEKENVIQTVTVAEPGSCDHLPRTKPRGHILAVLKDPQKYAHRFSRCETVETKTCPIELPIFESIIERISNKSPVDRSAMGKCTKSG